VSGVAVAVCALAIASVIEEDEPTPRTHVRSRRTTERAPLVSAQQEADVNPIPSSPSNPHLAHAAPTTAGQVLRQDVTLTSAELMTWIADDHLDPQVRYAALRRLEHEDPPAAVSAALIALDDVTPLVRLNAIAVLARTTDPRAAAALEKLDERSRRLAQALARR
jgi:HEAT repeat protein